MDPHHAKFPARVSGRMLLLDSYRQGDRILIKSHDPAVSGLRGRDLMSRDPEAELMSSHLRSTLSSKLAPSL